MVVRRVYVFLLRMHPAGFRDCFAGEMLSIFDEADRRFGRGWLMRDAGWSLARQWLMRDAAEFAQVRFGLLSGGYADLGPPHIASWLALALSIGLPCFFLMPPPSPVRHHVAVVRPEIRLEFSYPAPETHVLKRRR
jgi:hypothetical protein